MVNNKKAGSYINTKIFIIFHKKRYFKKQSHIISCRFVGICLPVLCGNLKPETSRVLLELQGCGETLHAFSIQRGAPRFLHKKVFQLPRNVSLRWTTKGGEERKENRNAMEQNIIDAGVAQNYWPPAPHLNRKNRRAKLSHDVAPN